jgi:hypothetical protein
MAMRQLNMRKVESSRDEDGGGRAYAVFIAKVRQAGLRGWQTHDSRPREDRRVVGGEENEWIKKFGARTRMRGRGCGAGGGRRGEWLLLPGGAGGEERQLLLLLPLGAAPPKHDSTRIAPAPLSVPPVRLDIALAT